MKKITFIFCFILAVAFSTSCTDDTERVPSVVGVWELTSWTIDVPIDLNNDNITSTNLLNEAVCENMETLSFYADGTVFSNATYNPEIQIALINIDTDEYLFNVICDIEGTIGSSGTFSQNGNSVSLFDTTAVVAENELIVTYENAINIYNPDFSQILETKNLALIYTKK